MNLCKLVSEDVLYLCMAYGARACLGDTLMLRFNDPET